MDSVLNHLNSLINFSNNSNGRTYIYIYQLCHLKDIITTNAVLGYEFNEIIYKEIRFVSLPYLD